MEGSTGILERRYLYIDSFVYIGKEASNLERTGIVDDVRYETYTSDEDLLEKVRSMSFEEAKKIGIPKTTYYRLKSQTTNKKDFKLNGKTIKKLIQ